MRHEDKAAKLKETPSPDRSPSKSREQQERAKELGQEILLAEERHNEALERERRAFADLQAKRDAFNTHIQSMMPRSNQPPTREQMKQDIARAIGISRERVAAVGRQLIKMGFNFEEEIMNAATEVGCPNYVVPERNYYLPYN